MKTKLLFLAILAVSAVYAQTTGQQGSVPYLIVLHYQGIPADGCDVLHEAINDQTGDRYGCNAGSWNKVSGLPSGLTSPSGVPCVVSETPSGGVAGAYGCNLPGLPNREVSGATDTILSTDCNPGIVRYIGSASVAVTLPTATTLAVPNCPFSVVNATTGSLTAVTVTPTTWTVNGLPSIAIGQGQTARFSVAASGAAWRADISNNSILTAPITVYFAAAGLTTCSYNGATGVACTPSTNAQTCGTQASPCQDYSTLASHISAYALLANFTAQPSDTAGNALPSGKCYQPSDVVFDMVSQGFSRGLAFDFDSTATGGFGFTDAAPTGQLVISGNTTTPANVNTTGATTCAGTTASTKRGLVIAGMNFRMTGVSLNYFAGAAIECVNNLCQLDGNSGTGDNVTASTFWAYGVNATMRIGPSNTVTGYNYGVSVNHGVLDDKDVAGCANFTFSSNINSGAGLAPQELAHEYISCGTYLFQGTGAYSAFLGQDQATIQANDAAAVSITVNDANLTVFKGLYNSFLYVLPCVTSFDWTFTNTASSKCGDAESGSVIGFLNSSGYGTNIRTDDVITTGGKIIINPFAVVASWEPGITTLPGLVHQTAQTGAITTATLCAAAVGQCNKAGQYHIHWDFWGSGTACSNVTAGSVTFLLTWTDANAVTHSAVALEMQAQTGAATEAVQASFPFQTALANESGSGDFTISTNGSVIQYATGYIACTTGTGTYNLDVSVNPLQVPGVTN